jgi:two-component system LytT family response regulator
MKVLIIEDEAGAAENLKAILRELDESIKVLAVIESVEDAVLWIESNEIPDLGFFDIQLADGYSFEIFEKTSVKFPVIFTTAFDEYAIKAFKVNSIDYILKPLNTENIQFALNKYRQLSENAFRQMEENLAQLIRNFSGNRSPQQYKRTILIPYKDNLIPLEVSRIAYVHLQNGIINVITHDSFKYKLDQSLDIIEEQLNPEDFFRINRQCVMSRKAIKEISYYFSGRFKLQVYPASSDDITVSKSRVAAFRKWMER